ncbi:hypothetical protein PCE1_001508 [Barthelona sp. PCE]
MDPLDKACLSISELEKDSTYRFTFINPNSTFITLVKFTEFDVDQKGDAISFDSDQCSIDSDYVTWVPSKRLCGRIDSFGLYIVGEHPVILYHTRVGQSKFNLRYETVLNTSMTACSGGLCYNGYMYHSHSNFNSLIASIVDQHIKFIFIVIGLVIAAVILTTVPLIYYTYCNKKNKVVKQSASEEFDVV